MAQVSTKIDWITATYIPLAGRQLYEINTYTDSLVTARRIFAKLGMQDENIVTTNISKHYDFTWKETRSGITLDLSRTGRAQGFRLVATGQNLSEYGDASELVARLRTGGWKLTRLDIAVDVIDGIETVGEIAEAWKELHGELKPYSSKHDVRRNGEMFTIGSRQSNRYLRIYDKAKEQNVNMRWLRCELELKGEIAAKVMDVAEDNPAQLAALALPLLGLPNSELAQVLEEVSGGESSPAVKIPRVKTNRDLWICNLVIPSITKLKETNPAEYERIRLAVIEALTPLNTDTAGETLAEG